MIESEDVKIRKRRSREEQREGSLLRCISVAFGVIVIADSAAHSRAAVHERSTGIQSP